MTLNKSELVEYRISRSKETLEEAKLLSENNHWNAVANRLYYACFYMVNALLIKGDIEYSSHNGVKKEFHKSYIKTNIIKRDCGKIYNRIFNLRQEGDYVDFKGYTKEEIFPFISDVEFFLTELEFLILQ